MPSYRRICLAKLEIVVIYDGMYGHAWQPGQESLGRDAIT